MTDVHCVGQRLTLNILVMLSNCQETNVHTVSRLDFNPVDGVQFQKWHLTHGVMKKL